MRIAEHMPRDRLIEAVGASTDTDVLFRSLRDAVAIGTEIEPDTPDPLTEAFLRGAERKRELLKGDGGVGELRISGTRQRHCMGM